TVAMGSSAVPAGGVDPLYNLAIQAEQACDYNKAIALWDELGRKTSASNNVLSMQSHNRAQCLRNYVGSTSGYRPVQSNSVCSPGYTPPDGRLVPAPAGSQVQPAPYGGVGQATSQYTYVKDDPRAAAAVAKPAYTQQPNVQAQSLWSLPGKLR